MPVTINPTNIVFNDGTTQSTAASSSGGTVTSVATGNGLQGGTITTTGTLSIAAPATNTVGSYAFLFYFGNTTSTTIGYGGTAAGGGGGNLNTFWLACLTYMPTGCAPYWQIGGTSNAISGTWRWMSGPRQTFPVNGQEMVGIGVRVS